MKTFIPLITTSLSLALCGHLPLHGQSVSSASGGGETTSITSVSVQPPVPDKPEDPAEPPALEEVQRAEVDAQDQLAKAQDEVTILNDQMFHPPGASGRTLILRSADTDPKEQGNLEEDMAVMSHILDKTVAGELGGQPGPHRAAGINILFMPGSNPPRNLYLDGYGALFMLNVNFPLLAPPTEPGTAKENQPTNSAWEEARHELYGQPDDEGKMIQWGTDRAGGPAEEYSEEKVSHLKSALIESLKNAANIRALKSDDWLTVCVVGAPASIELRFATRTIGGSGMAYGSASPSGRQPVFKWKKSGTAPAKQTIMTLRVKKSDIDAFAKGDFDSAKFTKKVSVATYTSGGDQD